MLLGLIALRIKGLYLALITLAYGFVAERSIFEIPFLTRGGAGMPATRPDGWASDREFAFLCFFFLAVVIYVDWRLIRSKVGRAILVGQALGTGRGHLRHQRDGLQGAGVHPVGSLRRDRR